jgi:hypothetical protein
MAFPISPIQFIDAPFLLVCRGLRFCLRRHVMARFDLWQLLL